MPIRDLPSPNHDARPVDTPIDMLILHYTGMRSAQDAIDRLREDCPVALAVSLHAGNDALRDRLVPINRKYPIADLMVFDLKTGVTTRMDVRDGQPFSNDVVGHYIWSAQWTKDSSEVLVNRADRRQKTIELAACSPQTGACRTVVREQRP